MTRLRIGSRTALTTTFIPGDLLLRESAIQSYLSFHDIAHRRIVAFHLQPAWTPARCPLEDYYVAIATHYVSLGKGSKAIVSLRQPPEDEDGDDKGDGDSD